MSKNSTTRYFLFNRNSPATKNGIYRSVKNADTRESAREYRRESTRNLGIYDRFREMVVS